MGKQDLQYWLLENAGFKSQLHNLIINSVQKQFDSLELNVSYQEKFLHDWNYLLLCASLLAQSEKGVCQDAALRIAQFTLESNSASISQKDAAAVVLDSLANKPAIRLAERRNLLEGNLASRLPPSLNRDWIKRSHENTIVLSDNSSLEVNKFQKQFWEKASENDWVSISAPTSAGKSFIVSQWLADFLKQESQSLIIYIVPTRALIQQVQQDIELLLKTEQIENTCISSLPLRTSVVDGKSNILVFTQERFHIFLSCFEDNFACDLLIIDEAHKIGDSSRGVLLQQAIESAVYKNMNCRLLFASPMTENPEIFLEDAPEQTRTSQLSSENITVNQNLIWVSQVPQQPKKWDVELIIENQPISLGKINLRSSPSITSKRLPFVAFTLANLKGGNVVYVNGASDAEKTAKQIYDLLERDHELEQDKDINNLIDLIKTTIHSKYILWNVLNKGIAFHYGNMPLIVRTEIERLFSINKIRFLVCTSTLIEGINMPCQSIFVRAPQKGRNIPMPLNDFWNLAGRAGRWGKEFQGNIICIDPKKLDVWKQPPPVSKTKYRISRTTDNVLNQPESLIDFIENKTPRDEALKNPKLEYVYSYLISSFIRNGSISNNKWAKRFSKDFVSKLDSILAENSREILTPSNIILRNPGISPFAMDELLSYFKKRTYIDNKEVEGLLPVPPESEDAVESYEKILSRVNRYLSKQFGWSQKRVWQLSLLIVNWMNGYPLAKIISSRETYYKRRGDAYKVSTLIRETMADVEGTARFLAPKYLSCYVDLLKHFLTEINRKDLLDKIIELNILLEFGVSQRTQLSLIGLGLSRSTAVSVSEFISDSSLDENMCLEWLLENSWMTEDMPELCKKEISMLIDRIVN